MEKKIDIFINNCKEGHFLCPMCSANLQLHNKSLICENKHTFDINKKGYVKLLRKFKPYNEEIYTQELFLARQNIINLGFYNEMHEVIAKIINSTFKSGVNVIEIGSGEGSHSKFIKNKIKTKSYYLTDLSTNAIQIASDLVCNDFVPIVCDAYNLPFNKIFDVAIDILSPYSYEQIYKVLKEEGVFIKVIPTQNYLKEIRELNDLKDYANESDVANNYKQHFEIIQEHLIEKTFSINSEVSQLFLKMTPLTNKVREKRLNDKITISLKVIVGRKKNDIIKTCKIL